MNLGAEKSRRILVYRFAVHKEELCNVKNCFLVKRQINMYRACLFKSTAITILITQIFTKTQVYPLKIFPYLSDNTTRGY